MAFAIPSWCDIVPSIFFLQTATVQNLTIFIMNAFYCHTEEALLPAPQVGLGVLVISTREMGAAGHDHIGGNNRILHKMTDLHLLAKQGSSRIPRDLDLSEQRKRENWDLVNISTAFPTTPRHSQYLVPSLLDQLFQNFDILNATLYYYSN